MSTAPKRQEATRSGAQTRAKRGSAIASSRMCVRRNADVSMDTTTRKRQVHMRAYAHALARGARTTPSVRASVKACVCACTRVSVRARARSRHLPIVPAA
eukprot:5566330-Pleurochrysis_carterae.AAC.2